MTADSLPFVSLLLLVRVPAMLKLAIEDEREGAVEAVRAATDWSATRRSR